MTSCDMLLHPALDAAPEGGSAPRQAAVSDRGRLALVLEAAALLAHLEAAGWRLENGWKGAVVDGAGHLRGVCAVSGGTRGEGRRALVAVSTLLFGGRETIAGRGEARCLIRRLVAGWRADPATLRADLAVAELLEAASWLWSDEFHASRDALGAVQVWNGRRRLWVAGPSWFRLAALARADTRSRLSVWLRSDEARDVWRHPPGPGSPRARRRSAVYRRRREALSGAGHRLAQADDLFGLGRFDEALRLLAGANSRGARLLGARCLLRLGRPRAARREVEALAPAGSGQELLAVARIAAAACRRSGDSATAARWVDRALDAVPGWLRPEAHLLAAEEAAAVGSFADLRHHLRRSRIVVEQPALGWRWYRAAGRGAMLRRRGSVAAAFFGRALAVRRRSLDAFRAALLWHGVARGRRRAGDLDAALRAAGHAARLHRLGGSAAGTRRCVFNLAEARLRCGLDRGVEGLLAMVDLASPELDAVALAARRELVRGRPRKALERLESGSAGGLRALRGHRAALAGRALGWMGRRRRARRLLRSAGERGIDRLEMEERPAVWSLAGDRRRARAAIAGPAAPLWRALLAGERSGAAQWAAVDGLGEYRLARLVYDAELLSPGFCPAARIERAARRLARLGAESQAARLEAGERSPWQALADFLDRAAPDRAGLGALLAAAGAPGARLSREAGGERSVLADGPGGGVELEAVRGGSRFVLSVPAENPRLAALLRLVADRWPPPLDGKAERGGRMVGESSGLATALKRAAVFARTDLPVLVLGETGTGKELLSRRVHELSPRAGGPFLPLNCAAVARELLLSDLFGHRRGAFTGADRDRAGIFEAAREGTVFLDEIGDLPPTAQGSLLRVLQEGEVRRLGESVARRVDARVVAATHRDLAGLVRRGRFRRDLFFRLEAATVDLPPLRRRGGDVLLLADHFLRRRSGVAAVLSTSARRCLAAYDWPGNVRELENALEVAVAMSEGGVIEARHLELGRGDDRGGLGYHARVARYRRRLIEEALARSGGNRAAAARAIGLSRQAISYLVRSLGIETPA